jgi:hypothetical protein
MNLQHFVKKAIEGDTYKGEKFFCQLVRGSQKLLQ